MATHWMNPGGKSIVKHPGALRATTKRMGLIKGDETLSGAVLAKLKRSSDPVTRRRATLAETYAKARH